LREKTTDNHSIWSLYLLCQFSNVHINQTEFGLGEGQWHLPNRNGAGENFSWLLYESNTQLIISQYVLFSISNFFYGKLP
jgi:hypothetical protein